jgi:endonuclease I
MNRILLIMLLFATFSKFSSAQIPVGYYNGTTGLNGSALKTKLHKIIRGHTERTYSQLWTDFEKTDVKANGKVWDMYSDIPGGTPSYEYTFGTGQCGTYSAEGDCYNREHSFPKSWWGGGTSSSDTMYTDLFHIVPTDGYVNNQRSSYPFGEIGTASWTSTNGSKRGTSNYGGYTGTVFEPIDSFKGDFARAYFYMATRYLSKFDSWAPNTDMLDGSGFSTWALNLLLDWHHQDTVSQKEINRNDSIYAIQGNRNPFIDHPEWVDSIWNLSPSTTAPIFTSGYPQSDNIASTSFDILVSQDKAGTAYYVVLSNGATAPTSAQVKAGEDASGTAQTANLKGSISISAASTVYSATISSLTASTDYDVYVVSEDNASTVHLQSSPTLVDVSTSAASSSTTYAEGFDVSGNWAGGSMTGYNAKTYTIASPSYNDYFSTNSAVRETSNTHSSSYSWRVDDASNHYLRYECEGTVGSFSVWAARWDNSPKPNVTVRYSVDGGSNYTTAFTFTGDDFSGDKVFKQFSHTFASPITNNAGSKIYIEFLTTTGERMLYDDFEVTFTASAPSNSNESDIVKKSAWTEPQNIDYTSYVTASSLTTSNSIEIAKFTIRDGGSDNTDADAVSTTLTDIDFVIDNYGNLDAIALFDGSTNLAEITNVTSTVSYTGLSIVALDESTKDFSVYVSFKTTVTDNENLKFNISSVTADASGSDFAASDGGGASTDNTANNNKIIVTADRLAYNSNKPPISVGVSSDFEVEVEAIDVNSNRDLDVSATVSLAKASGTGTLSSSSGLSQSFSSGVYLWADIQYDVAEDFTISASASGLTSVTSSTITASNNTYFSELIFTEYVEGSSNNKYLEIWNNTNASVDLSDYSIQIYYNGSSSVGATVNLTGTLAQDGIFVIANNSATVWSGTPDMTSSNINFNGNDAVVLVNNNAKGNVDVIGTIGSSSYYAQDKTLERNATTTGPNSTYTVSEWDSKSQDDVSGLGTPGPLPIELLSFNAHYKNQSVYLNWQTASETNNDYFSIEKSNDAENFEIIASIPGAGNSIMLRKYELVDRDIQNVGSLYYRLKQTDYDGAYSYSKVINVNITQDVFRIVKSYFRDGTLVLQLTSPSDYKMQLEIIAMNGQKIKAESVLVSKGQMEYEFNISSMSTGIYMIRLYNEKLYLSQKIWLK